MIKTKAILNLLVASLFLFSSCVENGGMSRTRKLATKDNTTIDAGEDANNSNGGNQPGSGNSAAPGDDTVDSGGGTTINSKVDLRHLVDPFDGTYKTKVTIPKNFRGYFYISGLNITSLSDRIITARFKFGRNNEVIEVPATIGRGQGITPQTDIELVILDMNNAPFENLRLPYDLYDYNNYKDSMGGETLEPTTDPRNSGLYCRGLNLIDDPTFVGSVNNYTCDFSGERCLYSYAKMRDAGLYNSLGVATIPDRAQIDLLANLGLALDSTENKLRKCLPDRIHMGSINQVLGTTLPNGTDLTSSPIFLTVGTENYSYKGPYRIIDEPSWEIKGNARKSIDSLTNGVSCESDYQCASNCCHRTARTCTTSGTGHCDGRGPTGLYKTLIGGIIGESFMFPRAGKMSIGSNVEHLSSVNSFDFRSPTIMPIAGKTEWMDGCNMRAITRNNYTNEDISSCNVTGTIELITRDRETGQTVVIAGSTTNRVKLQVIRESQTNYLGQEVLFSAMKTCSNSKGCASDECCYNNRCWSKEIVSQCLDESIINGNLGIGDMCTSDFQCSSFCCSGSTGVCAVHINTSNEQVLCSKTPGQRCIAKEWCRKENIVECKIVKTTLEPGTGIQHCALRCYNVPTFGECRSGICIPPATPPVPYFNPNDPDFNYPSRCNAPDVIDPPIGD